MQKQNSGDVFISYRHGNEIFVRPVVEGLKQRGITYFVDWKDIDYGDEYPCVIENAISSCKIFLFFWTDDVNSSEDIVKEITLAIRWKKVIIPYLIGDFNPDEHKRIIYQLASIKWKTDRKQTSESIKELIDLVESKLAAINSQILKKVELPEKIKDYTVKQYPIDNITIDIEPVNAQTAPAPVVIKGVSLPPMPKELELLFAENKVLQTAINSLKLFTHPSLSQANNAYEDALNQYEALKERKFHCWKYLSSALRQQLEDAINLNPHCEYYDLNIPVDEMDSYEIINFYEQFECGKKFKQAQLAFESVKKERKEKCSKIVTELQHKIKKNIDSVTPAIESYLDSILQVIFKDHPDYDKLHAMFPLYYLLDRINCLESVLCGYSAGRIRMYAEKYWSEKRPCVIEELERLQKEAASVDVICKQCKDEVNKYNRKWSIIRKTGAALFVLLFLLPVCYILVSSLYHTAIYEECPKNAWIYSLYIAFAILLTIILSVCYFIFKISEGNKIRSKYQRIAEQNDDLHKQKLGNCFNEIAGAYRNSAYGNSRDVASWHNLALQFDSPEALYRSGRIEQAALKGYLPAMISMADMRYSINDFTEAIKWYTKLASLGVDGYENKLKECYRGMALQSYKEGNIFKTIELCEQLIKQGVKDASELLAQSYCDIADNEYARNSEDGAKEAIFLYLKSAHLGNSDAMIKLANIYYNGKFVQQDIVKAVKWFANAAEFGNPEAIFQLAQCYENGVGKVMNGQKAYKLYCKAAEVGHVKAGRKVDELKEYYQDDNDYLDDEDDNQDVEDDDYSDDDDNNDESTTIIS